MFPHLFPLAIVLTTHPEENRYFKYWLAFSCGVLLFGLMGALVASFWKERSLRRAFYLGLGLPALLQVTAARVDDMKKNAPATEVPGAVAAPTATSAISLFAAPAFALEPPDVAGSRQRDLDDRTLIVDAGAAPKLLNAVFLQHDGARVPGPVRMMSGQPVPVPRDAASVVFGMDDLKSRPFALTMTRPCELRLTVDIEEEPFAGFLNSLGFLSANPLAVEVIEQDLDRRSAMIVSALSKHKGLVGFHLYPELPCAVVQGARSRAQIPADRVVLAVFDTTLVDRSSPIYVTSNGLFWQGPFESQSRGPSSLPYSALLRTPLALRDTAVTIGNREVSLRGSVLDPTRVIQILETLKQALRRQAT